MFERFTEKARRVIFFARYEASAFGSSQIELQHLLLGLLREDTVVKSHLEPSAGALISIRTQIEAHSTIGPQILTSVDMPLSSECRSILAYAAIESAALRQPVIDCGHLVLGLLKLEDSFAASLLRQHGITYTSYREVVRASGVAGPIPRKHAAADRAFERSPEPDVPDVEPAAPSLALVIAKLKSLTNAAVENLNGYSPQYGEQRLKRKLWSRKEALGHLVDMATAHHVWFVRVLAEPKVAVNAYPEDEWVRLEHYDRFSWPDLVIFGLD